MRPIRRLFRRKTAGEKRWKGIFSNKDQSTGRIARALDTARGFRSTRARNAALGTAATIGTAGIYTAWGLVSWYPLLSIPAATALVGTHWGFSRHKRQAARELQAKLLGKSALGEELTRKITDPAKPNKVRYLIKDPTMRDRVRYLTQQAFLSREERTRIQSAIRAGRGNEERLALEQGHALFVLNNLHPLLVSPLAKAVFRKKGRSIKTRSDLIHFIWQVLREPQRAHFYIIEMPIRAYEERWKVTPIEGQWVAKRMPQVQDQ